MNGINSPCKISHPNQTQREYEEELQNETIKTIHTTFQNLRDIDIIVIYIDLL
uniref:Uncharacterized protein n=1 Tax=Rhizophagus irregularis (strain DAOM 181602 / DAOM 197198 / MUCL 43194) TaxID=747089 RepID=U9TNZ4_RHIID